MNLIEQIDREIKHHQSAVSALTAAKKLLTAPSALPIKNKKASYPTISHRRTRQRLPKTLAKILTIVRENPDCSSGEVANILIKEEVIKNGTHARNTVSDQLLKLVRRRRLTRQRDHREFRYRAL